MEVRSQPAQQFHCHDLESGQSRIVVHGVLFLTHVVWVRLFPDIKCLLFASESCLPGLGPATPSLSHVATEGCRLRGADRNWQVHGQTAAPALSHALVISIVEDAVARLVTEDAVTLVGTLSWDSAGKYSIGEKYSRNPEGG